MLGLLEAVVGVATGSMLSGVVVVVMLAWLGVFRTTANLGVGEAADVSSLYGGDSVASDAASGGGGSPEDGYGHGPGIARRHRARRIRLGKRGTKECRSSMSISGRRLP